MKKKIGIAGGSEHAWVSVDRTRRFYIDALRREFDLVFIENSGELQEQGLDLLLNFAGNIGWEVSGQVSCPVIYCAHGGAVLDQNFLYGQLPKLRNCDGIIVNCHSDVRIFDSMCDDVCPTIYYLPLPVNEALFYPMEKALAKDALGIPEETLLIGHICRLLPQKNLHRFLHLFASIQESVQPRNVRALVVGNFWVDYPVLDYVTDAYPEYIEKLLPKLGITDHVTLLPAKLSDEELTCCYNALDLLVHPTHSLDENFGYVPVEAMACGVPVLGSAYGGLKDTVSDGETGYLMPTWVTSNGIRTDEAYGVKRAIELLHATPERKATIREACIQRVQGQFTSERCSDMLIKLVNKCITDSRSCTPERVQVKPVQKIDLPGMNLPKTKSGTQWDMYYDVVSHYVSDACPDFQPGTKVYTAYPLEYLGDNKVKIDDPTWPATYHINGDQNLLERIGDQGLSYETAVKEHLSMERIAEWLEKGLIALTRGEKAC